MTVVLNHVGLPRWRLAVQLLARSCSPLVQVSRIKVLGSDIGFDGLCNGGAYHD